jgi:hypothetical protein
MSSWWKSAAQEEKVYTWPIQQAQKAECFQPHHINQLLFIFSDFRRSELG